VQLLPSRRIWSAPTPRVKVKVEKADPPPRPADEPVVEGRLADVEGKAAEDLLATGGQAVSCGARPSARQRLGDRAMAAVARPRHPPRACGYARGVDLSTVSACSARHRSRR
jgi:hypothetical protein